MSASVVDETALSPAPILEAIERYRGTIVDVDLGSSLNADQFARLRERLTAQLKQAGLRSGGRVVVALPNGALFVATLAAILACEGSPLLVHHKTPPAELLRYARRFGCEFLASEAGEVELLPEVNAKSTDISFDVSTLRWYVLPTASHSHDGPLLRGIPLHPTSGSTGMPKVAMRPGFAAMEEARHYAETISIDSSDTILAVPPMSHAYGYGMCTMVPLLTGANIVSMRSFSAASIQRALQAQHVTVLPLAPAMLAVLAFAGRVDLRQTRWVLTAGSVLTRKTEEHFFQKTGVHCCPLYGTTETGGITIATEARGDEIDGRVGPPMAGISVRVESQAAAPEFGDGVGKLHVRSSSMMSGYLDDTGRVTVPLDADWFATGDLARVDENSSIHLRGRDSDVINVAGLKVTPCEVEEVIGRLSGVREVKVYGATHRSGIDVVKAAVALDDTVTVAEIRALCEEQLVYFKRPQTITVVDALPRNPAGKIIAAQLP